MNPFEQSIKHYFEHTGFRLKVLRNGWPDFLIAFEWDHPDHGYRCHHFALEVKHGRDELSLAQREMHKHLEAHGMPIYVLRHPREIGTVLKDFFRQIGFRGLERSLKPFRGKGLTQLAPPMLAGEEEWIG